MATDILKVLGRRVRRTRSEHGWTIRELGRRSGLSQRFIAQLEGGNGNISVRRLADLAGALGTTPAALLGSQSRVERSPIALLGLRGAGKTTVGRRLARRLRMPFVELDRRIERTAQLSLGELFSMHGETYYRRLEQQVLEQVLNDPGPSVIATGGGLVTSPETYARLRSSAVTIWLRARPEDYWERVVRQGDRRPMADHPQAMVDLRGLLAAREPLYAAADHTIDTSGMGVQQVVEAICSRIVG